MNIQRQVENLESCGAFDSLRPVFNTLVRGKPLNSGPRNLASETRKKRSIVRFRHIYIRLFSFVRVHAFDGQTDRQVWTAIARSNRVRFALKSLSFWGTSSPRPPKLCPWTTLDDFRSSDSPAPLAALSGNESLCFNLRLCFSNDVWLDDTDKNVGPDLHLLFKMYQICSVYSREKY